MLALVIFSIESEDVSVCLNGLWGHLCRVRISRRMVIGERVVGPDGSVKSMSICTAAVSRRAERINKLHFFKIEWRRTCVAAS